MSGHKPAVMNQRHSNVSRTPWDLRNLYREDATQSYPSWLFGWSTQAWNSSNFFGNFCDLKEKELSVSAILCYGQDFGQMDPLINKLLGVSDSVHIDDLLRFYESCLPQKLYQTHQKKCVVGLIDLCLIVGEHHRAIEIAKRYDVEHDVIPLLNDMESKHLTNFDDMVSKTIADMLSKDEAGQKPRSARLSAQVLRLMKMFETHNDKVQIMLEMFSDGYKWDAVLLMTLLYPDLPLGKQLVKHVQEDNFNAFLPNIKQLANAVSVIDNGDLYHVSLCLELLDNPVTFYRIVRLLITKNARIRAQPNSEKQLMALSARAFFWKLLRVAVLNAVLFSKPWQAKTVTQDCHAYISGLGDDVCADYFGCIQRAIFHEVTPMLIDMISLVMYCAGFALTPDLLKASSQHLDPKAFLHSLLKSWENDCPDIWTAMQDWASNAHSPEAIQPTSTARIQGTFLLLNDFINTLDYWKENLPNGGKDNQEGRGLIRLAIEMFWCLIDTTRVEKQETILSLAKSFGVKSNVKSMTAKLKGNFVPKEQMPAIYRFMSSLLQDGEETGRKKKKQDNSDIPIKRFIDSKTNIEKDGKLCTPVQKLMDIVVNTEIEENHMNANRHRSEEKIDDVGTGEIEFTQESVKWVDTQAPTLTPTVESGDSTPPDVEKKQDVKEILSNVNEYITTELSETQESTGESAEQDLETRSVTEVSDATLKVDEEISAEHADERKEEEVEPVPEAHQETNELVTTAIEEVEKAASESQELSGEQTQESKPQSFEHSDENKAEDYNEQDDKVADAVDVVVDASNNPLTPFQPVESEISEPTEGREVSNEQKSENKENADNSSSNPPPPFSPANTSRVSQCSHQSYQRVDGRNNPKWSNNQRNTNNWNSSTEQWPRGQNASSSHSGDTVRGDRPNIRGRFVRNQSAGHFQSQKDNNYPRFPGNANNENRYMANRRRQGDDQGYRTQFNAQFRQDDGY